MQFWRTSRDRAHSRFCCRVVLWFTARPGWPPCCRGVLRRLRFGVGRIDLMNSFLQTSPIKVALETPQRSGEAV
jgi:hypothetical protein